MAKKGEMTRGAAKSAANVPAVVDGRTAPGEGEIIMGAGEKRFAVKRIVTLPLLKHLDGMVVFIKILTPIYVGKKLPDEKGSTKANEKPADLVDIIELNTGRKMQYIVSAVCKSNLESMYANNGYVGKSFAIRKGDKVEGKRYRAYEILEIEEEQAAA